MAGEFDKDFGYLMPFLDRVAGAAASLADPAMRAELTKLMAEEKTRWARIRQLIGGASGQAQAAPVTPTTSGKDNAQATASTSTTEARAPHSFKLGTIRPKRT